MIASVTPIASGQPELAPEALFISALIDTGQYTPDKYQVLDYYFQAHRQVHEFCKKHQTQTDQAPSLNLLKRKFKSFPYLEGVHPKNAAEDLKNHWRLAEIRRGFSQGANAMRSDEASADEVRAIIEETLHRTATPTSSYATFGDLEDFEEVTEVDECPVALVADSHLEQYAGRIKPGNLWYVMADTNVGKSWMLMIAAVAAAEAGWDVWFYSTEMTRKEVQDRLHMIAFRGSYKGRWKDLNFTERQQLSEQWQQTSGNIYIHTPADGPLNASVIAGNHHEGSIAIVDYIGHMYTTGGKHAGEDHSIIASISTELKQVALAYNVPILCAAQFNREGARAGMKAGTMHVAGSYQLGRDGDVVLAMADPDPDTRTRVRQLALVKNRHGAAGHRWYYLLDIDARDFRDISYDASQNVIEADRTAKSMTF